MINTSFSFARVFILKWLASHGTALPRESFEHNKHMNKQPRIQNPAFQG